MVGNKLTQNANSKIYLYFFLVIKDIEIKKGITAVERIEFKYSSIFSIPNLFLKRLSRAKDITSGLDPRIASIKAIFSDVIKA
jgi:hypothetical protein